MRFSPPTRDQTHVPCIARQTLNHWTSREVPGANFLYRHFDQLLGYPLLISTFLRQWLSNVLVMAHNKKHFLYYDSKYSFNTLFFFFSCAQSALLLGGLSLVVHIRSLCCDGPTSHCSDFTCCDKEALGHAGFRSCGARAQRL